MENRQIVLLSGVKGSGKSSLAHLLLRTYQILEINLKLLNFTGGVSTRMLRDSPLTYKPDVNSALLNKWRRLMSKNHTTVLNGNRSVDVLCASDVTITAPNPLADTGTGNAANSVNNVIPLVVDNSDLGGSSTSRANKKHQLHVQVDTYTRLFIDHLAIKAEVKRTSELIRAALREFERALYEFDELRIPVGVGPSPITSNAKSSVSKDRVAPGTQSKPSDKDEHFSLVLDQREMDRVRRLKGLISAKSMADVVLVALCVYDALLDQRNNLVERGGEPAKIVRIDENGHRAGIG